MDLAKLVPPADDQDANIGAWPLELCQDEIAWYLTLA